MCQMLLSINPEYVQKIIDGTKRYEYRKCRCREDVDRILIYSTAPVKQIVAEAEIDEIIEDNIQNVWNQTKKYGGVSYTFFCQYYQGKEKAIAYHLKNIEVLKHPLSLEEVGVSYAPQSFRYLNTSV